MHLGKLSGILLPVFSLRSSRDWGIGDFGAAEKLFRWMTAARQRLWMFLPLLPTAPGDRSPYATQSAFGFNPLFVDLSAVPEVEEQGAEAALSKADRELLEQARASRSIQYGTVTRLKGEALSRGFERFVTVHWRTNSTRARELRAYQSEHSEWLDAFTLFAALSREQDLRAWWEWPEPLRNREPDALDEARRRLEQPILFHSWLQWIADTQWRGLRQIAREHRILLCGDEPFIVGQDSADTWAHPDILRREARLGVPPDDFSATGQDWGLPFFDFERMAKDEYRWLRFRAKEAASYFDMRRVDHAVGYFRQWIRDQSNSYGRFLPPEEQRQLALGEKLFRLLAEGSGIVAEDLGVVPAFVRETLTRLGLPGYRVLRWERDGAIFRNPHDFPPTSLVTTGSHDTETMREWWENISQPEREAVARVYPEMHGISPSAEFTPMLHRALLSAAEGASSSLCIIPWQDVLGTRDRINLPGTMTDSNWSYRMEQPVEELLTRDETRRAAEMMSWLVDVNSRNGNPPPS